MDISVLFCHGHVFRGISKSILSKAITNPEWRLTSCSFKDCLAWIDNFWAGHSSAQESREQTWYAALALSCNSFVFKFSLEILSLAALSGLSKLSPKESSLDNTHLLEHVTLSFDNLSRVPFNQEKGICFLIRNTYHFIYDLLLLIFNSVVLQSKLIQTCSSFFSIRL